MRIKGLWLFAAALALSGFSGDAAAAKGARPDPDGVVGRTVEALAQGDVSELEWLVSRVGSAQFPGRHYFERGNVFELLAGCRSKHDKTLSHEGRQYYQYIWACPTGDYIGRLVPDEAGHSVTIVDLFSREDFEEKEKRIPRFFSIPAPLILREPPRLSKEMQQEKDARERELMANRVAVAEEFAAGFAREDLSAFAGRHTAYHDLPLIFTDPHLRQPFVDKVYRIGRQRSDADALLLDLRTKVGADLGRPTGWECVPVAPYVDCTWRFEDPDTMLTAHMLIIRPYEYDWGMKIFRFEYATAERLAEAARRAEARR